MRNLRDAARVSTWLIVALLVLGPSRLGAQPLTQSWGPGGQVGDPSGLTVKYYPNQLMAYELVLSYDIGDSFLLFNGRYLFEQPIPESPLHFFLGPGVTFASEDDGAAMGASGTLGLNFFRERFEVFLHFTPRLNLVPDTEGYLGGGVGLHYYLP